MYIIQVIIFIFGISSSFEYGSNISCINPFTLVGDQCLFFGGKWSMNHENSKDICDTIGGWLARITTVNQHKAIFDHIHAESELDHSYWVDGSDAANTNIWVFSNGKLVPRGTPFWRTEQIDDENNTYIQRPDPIDGYWLNCLSLQKSFYYFFSDESCYEELSPLCEKEPIEGVHNNKSVSDYHTFGSINSIRLENGKPICGHDHVGIEGKVISPLYPAGAPDNLDCPHTITISHDLVTPQSYIALNLNVTNIIGTCGVLDYVEVRDGLDISSPLLTKYIGDQCCDPVNSTGPHMFILIHTDSGVNRTACGIKLDWKAVNTKCGSNITGVEGTLDSPRYNGHYFNKLDCQWTVSSTPELSTPDTHIILSIKNFDTEIGQDYLIIRDGESIDAPVLANLSGHEVTSSLHSSGQHLHFYFHTDESSTYEGFTIDWRAEVCPSPYMIIGGMCLKFIWTDLSWGEASVSCQEEGGELAALKEPQHLREFYLYLQHQGIEEDSFWLGGSDESLESLWRWKDGSLVTRGTPFWGLSSSFVSEEEEDIANTASNSWNGLFSMLKGYSSPQPSSLGELQEPDGHREENCLALLSEGFHFFRDVPCSWHLKAICSHPLH